MEEKTYQLLRVPISLWAKLVSNAGDIKTPEYARSILNDSVKNKLNVFPADNAATSISKSIQDDPEEY